MSKLKTPLISVYITNHNYSDYIEEGASTVDQLVPLIRPFLKS